jgi:hypothetical protein
MTDQTIENIIYSKRLPKDELDRFWINFWGFFPAIGLLVAGLMPLIAPKTTMSFSMIFGTLILGILMLGFAFYKKQTERNLKLIETGLNKENNEILLITFSQRENWSRRTNFKYFHSFYIPSSGSSFDFILTLIPTEKGVLSNLRNRGSARGRIPDLFGLDTIRLRKIEKKLKDFAQQK